jgi:hypothetical protein
MSDEVFTAMLGRHMMESHVTLTAAWNAVPSHPLA